MQSLLLKSLVLAAAASAAASAADCAECNMDLPQLAARWDYDTETHIVQTADSFLLTLFRLPVPRFVPATAGNIGVGKPVVLLGHALAESAAEFVINLPEQSLAFILADAGFDVWMANNRGNHYSPPKCERVFDPKKCWDFSIDDLVKYDFPATIDYVLKYTNQSKLSYIGHSQGTTIGFAGFSEFPELQEKVNLFVAVAPVAYIYHQTSPLFKVLASIGADQFLAEFGNGQFGTNSGFFKFLAKIACNGGPYTVFCEQSFFLIFGRNSDPVDNLNTSRIDVIVSHSPSGTSTKVMQQWAQFARSNRFGKYDYGLVGNLVQYGRASPPDYELSKVKLPIALFSGGQDTLSDAVDVKQLRDQLPASSIIYDEFTPEYDHVDYFWGVDACVKIYPQIIKLLKNVTNSSL